MTSKQARPNSDPLLLIAIRRDDQRLRLERILSRIWLRPRLLIESNIKGAIAFLDEQSSKGNPVKPDTFIIDLEDGKSNTAALLETARLTPGLRHAPIIALIDGESAAMGEGTCDTGADLVIPWSRLDARIGDIAALVVDSWLDT